MSVQPAGRAFHERALELAATAVDFDLTPSESAELAAHLESCPMCARRAAGMRTDALALGRPLVLLPSARVDAAVAAEIRGRRARPQRLVLIAVAALLTLALLGAAAIGSYALRNLQSRQLTVVPPSPPIGVTGTGPSASLSVAGDTWATIEFDPGDAGMMEAVTFAGTKLVGVGRGGCVPDFANPTDCFGAAWTAQAGRPWVRAADQPGLAVGLEVPTSGPEKGIFDVAAGPAGIVAVGHQYAGIGPGIWRSTDGQRWERVEVGSSVVDDFFVGVAAYPKGYVIVGRAVDHRSLTARAAAWVSSDGLTWTRVADTAAMDVGPCVDTGEEPDCGGMRAITWTGSSFVAVGQARDDFGKVSRPAAWTSMDGQAWTRSDTGLDFGGLLSDVAVGGPGVVAIGTICQPPCDDIADGVGATSRDGSTWAVAPITGSTELTAVASAGGATFAVGVEPGPAPPASLQLWRTTDGVDWQRLPGPPPLLDATSIHAVDVTSSGDRLVIVGWTPGDVHALDFAYESPPVTASPTAP